VLEVCFENVLLGKLVEFEKLNECVNGKGRFGSLRDVENSELWIATFCVCSAAKIRGCLCDNIRLIIGGVIQNNEILVANLAVMKWKLRMMEYGAFRHEEVSKCWSGRKGFQHLISLAHCFEGIL